MGHKFAKLLAALTFPPASSRLSELGEFVMLLAAVVWNYLAYPRCLRNNCSIRAFISAAGKVAIFANSAASTPSIPVVSMGRSPNRAGIVTGGGGISRTVGTGGGGKSTGGASNVLTKLSSRFL